MEKLLIEGGKRLEGKIHVSGAKNAAIAIIPAVLLVEGVCRIENIPRIKDVDAIVNILTYLGADVKYTAQDVLEIDARGVKTYKADCELARSMRASYYLLGALLGRFGMAQVSMPGGCDFGSRPIDLHIKGFEALGATVTVDRDVVVATSKHLFADSIYLDFPSVGATINIMLAATRVPGTTVIENAAKEPHVVDLANFLNQMGAQVKGAGTDVIRIVGTDSLHGGTYSIIPDQIEAGTYMIAAAAAGGDVTVENVIPKHMESLSAKLEEAGILIDEMDDAIRVRSDGKFKKINVKTMPYPGFPTDLQPQIVALLSRAQGTSTVIENVWDSRFQHTEELRRLGADIVIADERAIIHGVDKLKGNAVKATDLRAGAGMIIAGLMAEGCTRVENVCHIDRGYENLVEKLKNVGAAISRIDE
ncbi:MAG: UDP-N-acetylglucosamine 1-carboxyvinyltransferase [Ruminococcaceae bacterium]|nr:UDP-N-acetylglucosamine 1-carboxyvinyltransferase [Oscillospiraceae bacterium]